MIAETLRQDPTAAASITRELSLYFWGITTIDKLWCTYDSEFNEYWEGL